MGSYDCLSEKEQIKTSFKNHGGTIHPIKNPSAELRGIKIQNLFPCCHSCGSRNPGKHSCLPVGRGFPRVKHGAGSVKPGMTNRLRFMSLCINPFNAPLPVSLSLFRRLPCRPQWLWSQSIFSPQKLPSPFPQQRPPCPLPARSLLPPSLWLLRQIP